MKKLLVGILIIILGGLGITYMLKKEPLAPSLYAYIKENSLILWDQTANKKVVLSQDVGLIDDYVSLSKDKSKIIYAEKIKKTGMTLKVATLKDVLQKKEFKVSVIDNEIVSFHVVKDGIIYLKDSKLYYYDYKEGIKLDSNVKEFLLSEDETKLFYKTDSKTVYQMKIGEYDSKEKIGSDVLEMFEHQNFLWMKIGDSNSYATALYKDKEKIIDYYQETITKNTSGVYFSAYDSKVENNQKIVKQPIQKLSEIKEEKAILVFGSKNCTHCKNLENAFQNLSEPLSLSYYYLEATTMTDEDQKQLEAVFGRSLVTPLIFSVNQNTLSLIHIGEASVSELYDLVKEYEKTIENKVSTYRYYNHSLEKISDGICTLAENQDDNSEYFLYYQMENNQYSYFLQNQKTKEKIEIPYDLEEIIYDDKTKTIYYKKEDLYKVNIKNGILTEPVKLCEAVQNIKKDGDFIYAQESKTKNLYIIKEDKIEKIAENVEEYKIKNDQLYYRTETNELYYLKENQSHLIDKDIKEGFYIQKID